MGKKKPQLNSYMFPQVYKDLGIKIADLGCVMLDLKPLKNMYSIELEGAGVALYYAKDKSRFWIDGWVLDKVPHTTLLYGLMKPGEVYEKQIREVLNGWKMPSVEVEDIGYFDSPFPDEPYWCLHMKVKKTPKLLEGYSRMEFLPHVNTYANYEPHITICYLAKNQGEAYRDRMVKDFQCLWIGKKLKVIGVNLGGDYLDTKTIKLWK